VRGENAIQRGCEPSHRRYTPTCVGKTRPSSDTDAGGSVHPHVRGENYVDERIRMTIGGTPPRAWGKHYILITRTQIIRYTPTCVGKTGCAKPTRSTTKVHPHVRGENYSFLFLWQFLIRYTPTCVGKTQVSIYNRVRVRGTPPRAWGKLVKHYDNI